MKKFVIIVVLLFITYPGLIFGQTGIPRAQAMFIYNFSRLIEWPANYKSGPFVIGIFGSSAVANEITSYTTGKKVGTQSITVQQLKSIDEISRCHILFIPFSRTKQLGQVVAKISNMSTLVITEKNGAIDVGSAINFLIIGDKLKFEIKQSNASKYGIKVSSKLQEMAFKSY
ncbi:MAG: YfiR family protein [Bacteroidales bacterium]|nr:MAG: YfiR family protein [Bacteroidales bacterium]